MSGDLSGHVRAFLAAHVAAGARLCLGYSGGLDSSVLLHVLAGLRHELAFHLGAVHVHHGLSVNADAWVAHCRQACADLEVPLEVRRVAVAAGAQGIEAAAREARYRVFDEVAADYVVLAHHRDDQAETLLFRLLRGAGVHGLAAMAGRRATPGGTLLRPLLAVGRAELVEHARRHAIAHVDDESNGDRALTRNWLRHEVLPLLDGRFPASRRVLARTADQLAESAALLDDLAALDLARVGDGEGLRLAGLTDLGPARAANLLRHWLGRTAGVLPSRAWLGEALAQLAGAAPDRHPVLALGGVTLRRHGGRVVLAGPAAALPAGEWRWRSETELDLGGHGRLRFAPAVGEGLAAALLPPEGARIAWRCGGERLRPDCRRPARSLKNLLREAAVPAEARGRLPLLWLGDRLAWVAGIGVDCACQARPGEPGWRIAWQPRAD